MTLDHEWDVKARYYEAKVKEIRILEDVDSQDLRKILAGIDEVLSEATFDLSEMQDLYERASAKLTTALSEFMLEGKEKKLSDEKAKSYAQVKASEQGLVDEKLEASRRLSFMKNVVSLLKEKREMLVIEYGLIKIESGIAS